MGWKVIILTPYLKFLFYLWIKELFVIFNCCQLSQKKILAFVSLMSPLENTRFVENVSKDGRTLKQISLTSSALSSPPLSIYLTSWNPDISIHPIAFQLWTKEKPQALWTELTPQLSLIKIQLDMHPCALS